LFSNVDHDDTWVFTNKKGRYDQTSGCIVDISEVIHSYKFGLCLLFFMMQHRNTGWWFQTFFIFHNMWDVIIPSDELILFKMVKTTNQK
jgi:hypothetical protein